MLGLCQSYVGCWLAYLLVFGLLLFQQLMFQFKIWLYISKVLINDIKLAICPWVLLTPLFVKSVEVEHVHISQMYSFSWLSWHLCRLFLWVWLFNTRLICTHNHCTFLWFFLTFWVRWVDIVNVFIRQTVVSIDCWFNWFMLLFSFIWFQFWIYWWVRLSERA